MSTAKIRINTPTDVLDAVPVLMGFYPQESLVGLFLEETPLGLMLGVTARADLPTNETDAEEMTTGMARMLDRFASAIFVVYTPDQDEARTVMQRLLDHVDARKVRIALLASIPGWTTVDPAQPNVIQWTNPYPAATGEVAAVLAEAGMFAMGTREDLVDSIKTPDPETAEDYALGRSLDSVPTNPTDAETAEMEAEARRWITEYLHRPTTIIPEEAAYIAARIRFGGPRDQAVGLLEQGNSKALAAMWQAIAGLTPDSDALPVLAVLALSAWVSGDGALANVALERAATLPDGPGRTLEHVVTEILARQVHPSMWVALKRGL